MPNAEYHHAAMEYAQRYQEYLLRMEGVIGKRIEAKIEEIIDRKFHEYMEKANKESNKGKSL